VTSHPARYTEYSADQVSIDWAGESPEPPTDEEVAQMLAASNSINCKLVRAKPKISPIEEL
jgi:hypothetical protein